ncbi:zinc finger protein, putative [Plasmodium ovale wallikeri]|uniref:Zinc finger protein, putative n=2 Tax=Plasmodium ovale TaxID=36330 RepID=A0A1A8YQZ2_PLAOA|nr:zinc finger protein, putative [Plasmodium ovale wallikeri]SBT34550.1 zinc finger protein, putative [Plasmodium ovale wallikeri]SBT76661.1 zinc finger protein, putative [Plasmodium ovale]
MGRKKRKVNIDLKPFCYYCDREFDDEKVLIQHQKAKHFKCLQCNRKLDIASGLVVHMMQVHKTNLKSVPNSLPKRNDPEIVIRGMNGVPAEIIEENLNKLKQKLGDKNIKRQQRVNWAQVAMAPTMEQFLQQAQMGNFSFPGFNSPLEPTNNSLPNNTIDLKKKNMPPMPLYGPNTNANIMQPPPHIGANMYAHASQQNTTLPNMPLHLPSMPHNNVTSPLTSGFPTTMPPLPPNSSQKYPQNVNFPGHTFPRSMPTNLFPPPHSMYMPPGIGHPPVPPSAPPTIPPMMPPSAPPTMRPLAPPVIPQSVPSPNHASNVDAADAKGVAGTPRIDDESANPNIDDSSSGNNNEKGGITDSLGMNNTTSTGTNNEESNELSGTSDSAK